MHKLFLVPFLYFLIWSSGCSHSKTISEHAILNQFPEELVTFKAYAGNPVFAGSGTDTWDKHIRERGFILRQEDGYKLWYTGYNPDSSATTFLGLAISEDGIRWTRYQNNPIFKESWVEDVFVVIHAGRYYMFAEGASDIAHFLTSPDGIHWQDKGDLDIRQTDGLPVRGPYGTPTVWLEKGNWYLFYERDDLGIWLAVSRDGEVWWNVQDEPVLRVATDNKAVAADQIVAYAGKYYMYYHTTVYEPWRDWTTNVAMSQDLVHWIKYPGNPVVSGDKSSGILVHDGEQFRLYTMSPDVRVHFNVNNH